MTRYACDWVDAFADRPFAGNACVVVHGADDLSHERRLALVRETSLSECAYVVGSKRADFGVRYYLADREIPLAGHPTVATVVSLIKRGQIDLTSDKARFTLELGAGVIDIAVERSAQGDWISMTQPAPVFGAKQDPAQVAAIYGLDAEDILDVPQIVSTGTPYCVTVLRERSALRRAVLDPVRLEHFRAQSGLVDAALMEPFLVTLSGETPRGDTFSRLLLAPPSPAEDPFTGSATGCMGAYLWHHGLIKGPNFTAEQGHWMGRPGQARVEVLGAPDAISGVRVAGQGYLLMSGELRL